MASLGPVILPARSLFLCWLPLAQAQHRAHPRRRPWFVQVRRGSPWIIINPKSVAEEGLMRRVILTVVMGLLWTVGLMGCRGRLP